MSQSTSFSVVSASLDSVLARKSFSTKHVYFDVAALPAGGFALELRSADKAVIGKTDKPEDCVYLWNDKAGEAVAYQLLTSADKSILDSAADQLISFYATGGASFSARYNVLGEAARAALPFAISVFGHTHTTAHKQFKVGSYFGMSAKESAKASKAIADASKAMSNNSALELAVANATGGKANSALMAMVAATMRVIAGNGTPEDFALMAAQSGGATVPAAQPIAPPVVAPSLTIENVMERLLNPSDESAQVYADAIDHIATGGASVERLYVEALEGSADDAEFTSCVATLVAERVAA